MNNGLTLSELVLEVTNACHYRCIHCSTVGGLPLANELTQEERLRVVRDACTLGLRELRLLGGDPLLRMQETFDLVSEANKWGLLRTHICTSAAQESLDWISSLKAFTPIQVSADASIYGAKPCIHDAITLHPGSFDRLLSSSREAVKVGFDLSWNFVWMKPNFADLIPVVRLASEIGIKRVRVLRLMLNGRAKENRSFLELPPELEGRCHEVVQILEENDNGVELAYSKPLSFLLKKARMGTVEPCGAGCSQLVVQADGIVLPCVGMKGLPEMVIGNVREDNLVDILSRAGTLHTSKLSHELDECPAVLFQKGERLVQVAPSQGRG